MHRYHRHRRYGVQLAPTSGAMGYGLPAGDRRARPCTPTGRSIAFAGDGCFMMACQELATAVQFDLPIVVVRRRQRHARHDPDAPGAARSRAVVPARRCTTPTSSRWPGAFGCHAEQVMEDAGFPPALARALDAGQPALLHLVCDPQAITPATTLDALGGKS